MNTISTDVKDKVKSFILEGIDISSPEVTAQKDPFWESLQSTGTEIWLDTGDIDAASKLWSAEMRALTTNNTLLNKEIQKGIYDDYMKEANEYLKDLDLETRIMEIAFILNARHGLRLVQKFGGKVSVELHTNLSHDYEGIIEYGQRFHEICPSNFIIKVPLTPTGLLGARRLRELGIAVNFTLGFSARQNAIITKFVKPNYVNVFLGRLNSYVKSNMLGDGTNVGEKATIASQHTVNKVNQTISNPVTKQIAASMRSSDQLKKLAGVDVFTMPANVAEDGHANLDGAFESMLQQDYKVSLKDTVDLDEVQLEKCWEVGDAVFQFAEDLDKNIPFSAEEIIDRAHKAGLGDMFPQLNNNEEGAIKQDGKIPNHNKWSTQIRKGEVAVDTLLNLGGLSAFEADQAALDDRIKSVIT